MIQSLHIKNIATFDANTGVQINNLKKTNFIYGTNGCGKTTISNYLQELGDQKFANCSLQWEHDTPIRILVYNKTFRDRNYAGNIKGIFTLGEATKNEIDAIDIKKTELKALDSDGIEKKAALDKLNQEYTTHENNFKETAWTQIFKKYESAFKEAFRGNALQKESFKNKLLSEFTENKSDLVSYDKLIAKADTIFRKTPSPISEISNISFNRLIELENDKIWQKKIVGKSDIDIAKLIQKLNLNDWVNEGRQFLQDDMICPFCQQETITADFKQKLEQYFDQTFINDINLIKDNSDEYIRTADSLLGALSEIEKSEQAKDKTKLLIQTFSEYLKTFSEQLTSNREFLHSKLKEPSRSISLISIKDQLEYIEQLILAANEEIRNHNKIVQNYAEEKNNLISSIWKFLIDENKVMIQSFITKKTGLQKGVAALTQKVVDLREKYKNLDLEIKELGKNITSVQPSVDEINKTLKSFGFHNFEIVSSKSEKNHYQIQREDGSLGGSTLSEGEVTFITFLYFMQLAKGGIAEDHVNENRILVIDDPISSLDSNVLFIVSSLLKEIRKSIFEDKGNIKQLIILTHNVYFHKEVSFIDGRTQRRGDANFWILRKNKNCTSIQAFEMENPIQNSYELLWKELRNRTHNSGSSIQNTMRRIIENYFKILGKYGDDDLITKFQGKEEQEICRSLLCWINDGSHCIPDDFFIEDQGDILEKYFDVFKNIFVHTNHIEHYNMMMRDGEL